MEDSEPPLTSSSEEKFDHITLDWQVALLVVPRHPETDLPCFDLARTATPSTLARLGYRDARYTTRMVEERSEQLRQKIATIANGPSSYEDWQKTGDRVGQLRLDQEAFIRFFGRLYDATQVGGNRAPHPEQLERVVKAATANRADALRSDEYLRALRDIGDTLAAGETVSDIFRFDPWGATDPDDREGIPEEDWPDLGDELTRLCDAARDVIIESKEQVEEIASLKEKLRKAERNEAQLARAIEHTTHWAHELLVEVKVAGGDREREPDIVGIRRAYEKAQQAANTHEAPEV